MRCVVVITLFVLASCGTDPEPLAAAPASPSPTASAQVVLCLGDSLTAGFGIDDAQAWPSLIDRALGDGVQVINAGVSGDTTTGGLERLSWALRAKPDVAIVALGANDGLRGTSPELTKTNLETIIGTLKEHQVTVLLAGMQLPTNLGSEHTEAFKGIYPALAEEHDLALMPFLLEGVAMQTELNLADGIHPNEAGHAIIADNVLTHLRPLLEVNP